METKITATMNPDGSATVTIPPFVLAVLKAICPLAGMLPPPANIILSLICQIFNPAMKLSEEGGKPCDCH